MIAVIRSIKQKEYNINIMKLQKTLSNKMEKTKRRKN